jgi:hypothetical protein
MSNLWIKEGGKCVCIQDIHATERRFPGEAFPIKGNIYTIDGIKQTIEADGRLFIYIKELNHEIFEPETGKNLELTFASWLFGPIEEFSLEQDISKFKHLLNTNNMKEDIINA